MERTMKFQVGDLYFIRYDNIFGKAVDFYNMREFGRTDCTHVGIISMVGKTTLMIHEAGPSGFKANMYDIDELNKDIKDGNVKICRVKESLKEVHEICKKYEGIRYGFLDLIGIMLSSLIGWKMLGITGKNAIICSEAVSRIIYDCTKRTNIAKEYGIKYDNVSPEHIYLSRYVKWMK